MSYPILASRSAPRKVIVLLVDDQPIVGEAIKRMLADEPETEFHYCSNPFEAIEMANQVSPTVILQDLVMPEIDGLSLVKFFRAGQKTQHTPIIVLSSTEEPVIKAKAFGIGANDYLVKLPDQLELVARIRYHSNAYHTLLERNEAFAALEISEKRLAAEMDAGAKYVESILPPPITSPFPIDWRFIPSAELGGDSLGYFQLDERRFVFYLLDVTGHGLASALLGVTVCNLLRSRAIGGADLANPAQVLASLNRSFKM